MPADRALSKTVKITMVLAGAATGSSALTSAAVDMKGFEGVVFIGRFLTAHASNSGNLAISATSGGSFADLVGTKVVPGDNGDSFLIDVKRSATLTKTWIRCEIVRSGADTVTGDVYAIQYGAAKSNPGHGSTIDAETHIDAGEGTA